MSVHVLQFFAPHAIVRLIASNPINWYDRELTRLGGPADKAASDGFLFPAMEQGLRYVKEFGELPTQQQYIAYCLSAWAEHIRPGFEYALEAKLGRNFYVALIDQFHAFGLVANSGWYDSCLMHTGRDVLGKADLIFVRGGNEVAINLKGPASQVSREAETWKSQMRGKTEGVVEIRMPWGRPPNPGNKRWYSIEDFAAIQPRLIA